MPRTPGTRELIRSEYRHRINSDRISFLNLKDGPLNIERGWVRSLDRGLYAYTGIGVTTLERTITDSVTTIPMQTVALGNLTQGQIVTPAEGLWLVEIMVVLESCIGLEAGIELWAELDDVEPNGVPKTCFQTNRRGGDVFSATHLAIVNGSGLIGARARVIRGFGRPVVSRASLRVTGPLT